jgi:putative ABC transport system permease protein
VVLSPEYVFATKSGDPLPDDKQFGILWMERKAMAAAFDLDGITRPAGGHLGLGRGTVSPGRPL